MREIYFIRHCESQANAGLQTHSPETIALTERGFEQSKYIPSVFTKAPGLIITSPFLRTRQTAEPTIEKFYESKVEEWDIQEFTYLSLVKYADTTMAYRAPFVKAYWENCETEYCDGDGAESFSSFISRVKALLERILKSTEKTIAVFSHGQFMKALVWLLVNDFPEINNASMRAFHSFLHGIFVPNASVFKLFIDETGKDVALGKITNAHLPNELKTS